MVRFLQGRLARRLSVLVLLGTVACNSAKTDRPPNFLLILTDDQGCGDAGFQGNEVISTPSLDRLAAEGTTFSSFYVSPVCAPTRASLLTGRYHQRTGVRGVIEGREFMVEEEITVAEMLQRAGYRTALIGKWHLGENYPWVPHAQGFDQFIGFRDGSSRYFDQVLEKNGEPYPTEGYLTDVFTNEAIRFLQEESEPFFLYLSYNAPHTPLEVPQALRQPYSRLPEYTQRTYAMVDSVDRNLARLLEAVESLGLEEETVVIFLSDNGPLFGGSGFETDLRFNCGLRGRKYQIYEGGIRVPFTIRWPGRIAADRIIESPAAHIDLFPTLLDLAGVETPAGVQIDGVSLKSLLLRNTPLPERTLFQRYPGEQALRAGDTSPFLGAMARGRDFKWIGGNELYLLETDPGEEHNRVSEYPELRRELESRFLDFRDSLVQGRAPYPRVQVGHEEENPTRLTVHWARLEGEVQWQFTEAPPRYRGIGVHGDWLSAWSEGDRALWRLDFQTDARYRLTLRYRCRGTADPPRLRFSAGEEKVSFALSPCSDEWEDEPVANLPLRAGQEDLVLEAVDLGSSHDLDIAEVGVGF